MTCPPSQRGSAFSAPSAFQKGFETQRARRSQTASGIHYWRWSPLPGASPGTVVISNCASAHRAGPLLQFDKHTLHRVAVDRRRVCQRQGLDPELLRFEPDERDDGFESFLAIGCPDPQPELGVRVGNQYLRIRRDLVLPLNPIREQAGRLSVGRFVQEIEVAGLVACHGHVHQLAPAVRACGRPAVDAVGMVDGELDLERGTIVGGRGQGIFVFRGDGAGQMLGSGGNWRWRRRCRRERVARRPQVPSGRRDLLGAYRSEGRAGRRTRRGGLSRVARACRRPAPSRPQRATGRPRRVASAAIGVAVQASGGPCRLPRRTDRNPPCTGSMQPRLDPECHSGRPDSWPACDPGPRPGPWERPRETP